MKKRVHSLFWNSKMDRSTRFVIQRLFSSLTLRPLHCQSVFRQISGSDDVEQERRMTALLRQFAVKRSVILSQFVE